MYASSVRFTKKEIHGKRTILKGIVLQDVFYKSLANVIQNKLEGYIENLLGDYQCEFCKLKSIIDQIFILRQILEKHMSLTKKFIFFL